MQNINIVNVSKTLLVSFSKTMLEMLNATYNASKNARLPNTKILLINVLTWLKRYTLFKTLLPNLA